ncbi:MAG TPA: hypothetical protein VLK85_30245 [Ramlibacter sp.]|nr:hypothetical protein [Ramlibacter sp.]
MASATLMAANAQAGTPDYCQVLGAIAPRSRTADPIRFQLNLPLAWNGAGTGQQRRGRAARDAVVAADVPQSELSTWAAMR